MKKAITWIIVIAIIGGGVWGFFQLRSRRAQAQNAQEIIRTAEIEMGDLTITVPASGNVAVTQRADLSFDMPGNVVAVDVAVSDRVKAGQELTRLNTEALDDAIRQAQIALDQATVSLALLREPANEADIRLAELAIQSTRQSLTAANLSKTSAEAQRNQSVSLAQDAADKTEEAYENFLDFLDDYGIPTAYASGITVAYLEAEGNVGITQVKAEYQIQQAQNQWMAAYQALQQAEQALDKLEEGADDDQIRQTELQIEQARISLDQASARLDDTIITAPFDGIIAAVNVQEHTPAPTGLPAITLLDDSKFFIDVTVDEIDIGQVAVGQDVQITVDAYPDDTIAGVVERIAAVPSNVSGIIAYLVRIQIADTVGTDTHSAVRVDIREGMTASVTIHTDTVNTVLLIPNWAIRTDQKTNETYAYRMQDGTPTRTTVTLGARDDVHTVVLSGLEAGDTIALVVEESNLFEGGPPGMRQ